MAKKLFLHIGSYKTGTTSIQNALAGNRNELAKQDFLYPGRDVNHHKFIFSYNPSGEDIPRQFRGVDKVRLKQIVSAFFKEIEAGFNSQNNNYILSTEYLFIHNENSVAQIINYLKRYMLEIEVILFVRNPVDYYASFQQQAIKARSFVDSSSTFKYDFKKVIETWKSFCPVKVLKYGGEIDSFDIFCEEIGVDANKFTSQSSRINTSLDIEQMLLLEKIQNKLYQSYEDRFKNHLGVIHQIKFSGLHKPELKTEIKKLIYNNHLEDLQWLKENYGINFLDEKYEVDSTKHLPSFEENKASVREVFKVPDEQMAEKFEAHVIDLLLKKLVQRAS